MRRSSLWKWGSHTKCVSLFFYGKTYKLFIDLECHFYWSPKLSRLMNALTHKHSKIMSSSCLVVSLVSLLPKLIKIQIIQRAQTFSRKEKEIQFNFIISWHVCESLFFFWAKVKRGEKKLVSIFCARINFYIDDNIEVLFIRIYFKFHPGTFFFLFAVFRILFARRSMGKYSPCGWNVP